MKLKYYCKRVIYTGDYNTNGKNIIKEYAELMI